MLAIEFYESRFDNTFQRNDLLRVPDPGYFLYK